MIKQRPEFISQRAKFSTQDSSWERIDEDQPQGSSLVMSRPTFSVGSVEIPAATNSPEEVPRDNPIATSSPEEIRRMPLDADTQTAIQRAVQAANTTVLQTLFRIIVLFETR